jgi:GR25 family glycosyltransferase involved in LPS biosynthesis
MADANGSSSAHQAYRGVFINLDRATERKKTLERQFNTLRLADRYRRFAAIDGATLVRPSRLSPGAIGVFASHLAVLEQAAKEALPTHVIEDDVILGPAFDAATLSLRGLLRDRDILFTEIQLPLNLQGLKVLKQQYDAATVDSDPMAIARRLNALDLARVSFAGATSYFVSPKGAARLAVLLRSEWESGPTLEVDLVIRREVHKGRIRAGCLFPFVTTIALDSVFNSTINGLGERPSPLAIALLRYAFFVGADLQGEAATLLSKLSEWADGGESDQQRRFLGDVLGIILSRRFEMF